MKIRKDGSKMDLEKKQNQEKNKVAYTLGLLILAVLVFINIISLLGGAGNPSSLIMRTVVDAFLIVGLIGGICKV